MSGKVISAIILAVAILVSEFAGCGDSAQHTVSDQNPTGNTTTQKTSDDILLSQEETTDYLMSLPDNDQNGKEFTIVAQHTVQRFNFTCEENEGDVIDDAIRERDSRVEERLNIKLNRISYEDRGKLKTDVQKTVLAGDSAYDMIITSMSDGINTLGPNGVLYDLNKMPYLDLTADWWNRSIHDDMQISGHQLFTTGSISPCYYLTPIVMIFNKRLIEDYGIGNLYQTVYDGDWYFDKFISMVDGVSYDLNADGKMNHEDFYGFTTDTTFGNALYAAAGFKPVKRDGDTLTLDLDSQASIDMIEKCGSIFSDKSNYIIYESAPEELTNIFKTGRALFAAIYVVGFAVPYRDMEDDYGILPLPKYRESDSDYLVSCNTWMPTGVAVPITCPDTEFTGLVMETMAYTSYQIVGPAVYETALRGKATRDSESYEMLEFIYRNIVFDFNTIFNFGGSSELMRSSICGLKTNFVSNYVKIKDKAQKALDDMVAMVNENYSN